MNPKQRLFAIYIAAIGVLTGIHLAIGSDIWFSFNTPNTGPMIEYTGLALFLATAIIATLFVGTALYHGWRKGKTTDRRLRYGLIALIAAGWPIISLVLVNIGYQLTPINIIGYLIPLAIVGGIMVLRYIRYEEYQRIKPIFQNLVMVLLFLTTAGLGYGASAISGLPDNVTHTETKQQDPAPFVIQDRCERQKDTITAVCSLYVSGPGACDDISEQKTDQYNMTATDAGCDIATVLNGLGDQTDITPQVTVTIRGTEYSCIEEGYINTTCPG